MRARVPYLARLARQTAGQVTLRPPLQLDAGDSYPAGRRSGRGASPPLDADVTGGDGRPAPFPPPPGGDHAPQAPDVTASRRRAARTDPDLNVPVVSFGQVAGPDTSVQPTARTAPGARPAAPAAPSIPAPLTASAARDAGPGAAAPRAAAQARQAEPVAATRPRPATQAAPAHHVPSAPAGRSAAGPTGGAAVGGRPSPGAAVSSLGERSVGRAGRAAAPGRLPGGRRIRRRPGHGRAAVPACRAAPGAGNNRRL